MDDRMSAFVVGSNYQVLDVIGEGAYGIVWSVPFLPLPRPRTNQPVLPAQLRPSRPLPAQGRNQAHNAL